MQISDDRLYDLSVAIIHASCGNEAVARIVARRLVEANLTGHDSHGVGVLPGYIEGIRAGQLNAEASVEIIEDKGPFLLIDGHCGFGQVVAEQAMDHAIARAEKTAYCGVVPAQLFSCRPGWRLGGHGGRGRVHIDPLHQCSVAELPCRAPWRQRIPVHHQPLLHGNSGFGPTPPMFLLDMATSTIAMGKTRVAYMKGVEVADDCLIDHRGNPTNDPAVMFEQPKGALRTMGLHKGYGLALLCDILAGSFSGGGAYLPERVVDARVINNMLAILIDPDVFGGAEAFFGDIDNSTDWIKSSPPAPGVDEVMFPGDPERKTREKRKSSGIPIDDGTWAQLMQTAEGAGLSADAVGRIIGE